MLLKSNKPLFAIQEIIGRMMNISRKYGKKMGAMGTLDPMSTPGASFARQTADIMSDPVMGVEDIENMLGKIFDKAGVAKMSDRDLGKFRELESKLWQEIPGASDRVAPKTTDFSTAKQERMRLASKKGLL